MKMLSKFRTGKGRNESKHWCCLLPIEIAEVVCFVLKDDLACCYRFNLLLNSGWTALEMVAISNLTISCQYLLHTVALILFK